MHSKELLKGTLKTIVLKLLSEHDRMYGYEITRHVEEQTKGELILTEGALYPTLHKLEKEGLVRTEKVYVGKRARRYYSLTPSGSKAGAEKVQEFRSFVKMMNVLLKLN